MNPKEFDLEDLSALLRCAINNLLVLHDALDAEVGSNPACDGVYSVWAQLRWIADEMSDQIARLTPEMLAVAKPE